MLNSPVLTWANFVPVKRFICSPTYWDFTLLPGKGSNLNSLNSSLLWLILIKLYCGWGVLPKTAKGLSLILVQSF